MFLAALLAGQQNDVDVGAGTFSLPNALAKPMPSRIGQHPIQQTSWRTAAEDPPRGLGAVPQGDAKTQLRRICADQFAIDSIELCQRIRQAWNVRPLRLLILLTSKEGRQNMLDAMQAGGRLSGEAF